MIDFNTITRDADKPNLKTWSNRDVALFHYLNPNGLLAQKRKVDDRIDALVDAGKAMSGAIIAYGALSYFYTNLVAELASQSRVNWIKLSVALDGVKDDIRKAEQFIAERSV